MRRRSALLALPVALALGVRAGRAQPALRPLSIGLVAPGAVSWQTYVAQELNLYAANGLDATTTYIGSSIGATQQVIAHSLDVAALTPIQIVQAVRGGAALHSIYTGVSNAPYRFLAQKQYKRYADLKGKLLMIDAPNGLTAIFAQKMLASGGVKMSDVDFIYAGATADRYVALRSGSIAATLLSPPFSFRAAADGYSVLGTLAAVMPAFPFVTWGAADDWAAGHGELIVDFCKAELAATCWLNQRANRDRALDILVKRANTSRDDAAKSYDEVVVQDRSFPNDGAATPRMFAQVIEAMLAFKLADPPLGPPQAYYDNRYVAQAAAALR